jgi:hypothetical protein
VGHTLAVANLGFFIDRILDLIDRNRFARQRRFLDAQIDGEDEDGFSQLSL